MKSIKNFFIIHIVFIVLLFVTKQIKDIDKNDIEKKVEVASKETIDKSSKQNDQVQVESIIRNLAGFKERPEHKKFGADVLSKEILRKYPFLKKGELVQEEVFESENEGSFNKIRIFKTNFKYPNIRVVEEFKKSFNEKGTLIGVMVADHLILKLNDVRDIELIQEELKAVGASLGVQKKYSKIYTVEFDIENLEDEDRFQIVSDFLKSKNDILKYGPDHIFSIY